MPQKYVGFANAGEEKSCVGNALILCMCTEACFVGIPSPFVSVIITDFREDIAEKQSVQIMNNL